MSDTAGLGPAGDRGGRDGNDHLEMWVGGTVDRIPLRGEAVTIGQAATNDVPVPFDRTVSRVHAVLERVASRWSVRDLSSRNGTFVNGTRIWAQQPLRAGDEIRVGSVRFVVRLDDASTHGDETVGAETGPVLTRREREVLVALCSPMFSGDVFREPASTRQIASALVITEAAVKQHLSRLYDKFGIYEQEGRRVRLANEAIRRGAVNTAEILGRKPGSG
jgi:pSer/pThr/pTyr-binding forkhead associated (FHA) protein